MNRRVQTLERFRRSHDPPRRPQIAETALHRQCNAITYVLWMGDGIVRALQVEIIRMDAVSNVVVVCSAWFPSFRTKGDEIAAR